MNYKRTLLRIIPLFAFYVFGCKEEIAPIGIAINGEYFTEPSTSIVGESINNEGHATISMIFTKSNGSWEFSFKKIEINVEYSGNSSVIGTYSFPQAKNDKYLNENLTYYANCGITLVCAGVVNGIHLSEGTVTIQDNGNDNYTIDIDLVMEDETTLKGTHTGDITVVFNNG